MKYLICYEFRASTGEVRGDSVFRVKPTEGMTHERLEAFRAEIRQRQTDDGITIVGNVVIRSIFKFDEE